MIDYNALTEKQQKRYNRILRMAENLMYQQGFHKLSISDLTNKLKISRSTIYEYFDNKEGLVEKVVDSITARLNTMLEDVLNDETLSSSEKFIQLSRNQGNDLNSACYPLLSELKNHLPELYIKFENGRKNREKNGYRKLVEQGIEEGIFDEKYDKDFLVQLYLKMAQLTAETDIAEKVSFNKQEVKERIVRVFLNGTKKYEL